MICSTCRRHLLSRLSSAKPNGPSNITRASSSQRIRPSYQYQSFHTIHRAQSSAGIAPSSSSSPAVAQPLSSTSVPDSPDSNAKIATPVSDSTAPNDSPAPQLKLPISSVPGGLQLRGVDYLKDTPKVLAKEDREYPEWLWGLLDKKMVGGAEVDEFGLEKVDLSGQSHLPLFFFLLCPRSFLDYSCARSPGCDWLRPHTA